MVLKFGQSNGLNDFVECAILIGGQKRMCVVRTVLPPELPELPDPDPFEPDPVSVPDPDPPPPPPITIESSLFQVSFILLSMKILVSKSYKNG